MIAIIDQNRDEYGVESICRTLPIAPSTYHAHDARRRRPERSPPRVQRDVALKPEIQRVFDENFRVYGARKVWLQMNREGVAVARGLPHTKVAMAMVSADVHLRRHLTLCSDGMLGRLGFLALSGIRRCRKGGKARHI